LAELSQSNPAMTAAVALALPQEGPMETSALARRSRMGILRGNSDPSPEVIAAGPPPKKRKVSGSEPVSPNGSRTSIENSSSAETKEGIASKKAQKKYEPSVPMTKEEAAAWRREQRRKRNRESAAASRQKQRDRIVELEAVVEDWKAKFASAMVRLQALEGGSSPSADILLSMSTPSRATTTEHQDQDHIVSRSPSPSPSSAEEQPFVKCEKQQQHHLIETISRPA